MINPKHLLSFLIVLTLFISCKPQADKDWDEVGKLIYSDRCSDAIQLATKCIAKYPANEKFYYLRGYCLLKTDNWQAKEDFTKCIKIDPKYSLGYYGLAIAYMNESQFDLAEKHYNKAIEMDPKNSAFLSGLASMYAAKKDYHKAIEIIKKSIELNDEGSEYFRLGILYWNTGQTKEAERMWLKAINEKKFTQIEFKHETYYELAKYYFQEKDYKRSKAYIEKAIELAPDNNKYVSFNNQVKSYVK